MRSSSPAGPEPGAGRESGAPGRESGAPGGECGAPTAPAGGLVPLDGAAVAAAVRRAAGDNPLLGIGLTATGPGIPAESLCAADGTARDLIEAVGRRYRTGERRVAASMVVLGYSARLVGPAVSLLIREGLLLDLRPVNVRFAYDPRRGFGLDLVRPAGWRGAPAALREGLGRVVVDDHLRPVIDAVRAEVPVAPALLWGNVASGLAGALRALEPVARCHAEGLLLLDHGPLRGSGYLAIDGGQLRFVRRSCCLYYRIGGGGMCGDCVLLHRD